MDMNSCECGSETAENMNLWDMPYAILSQICDDINIVPGLVDKLIATQDNTIYKLSIIEANQCHNSRTKGPCEEVLHRWGNKGMTIRELINSLDMLRLEKSLSLLIKPTPLRLIKDIPSSLKIEEGDTLKIECYVKGFPYPTYCWFRGKRVITQNKTGQLQIENVGLNDTGSYICRVHNYLKKLEEVQWTSRCEVYVEESLHRHIDKMAIHDNSTNNHSLHPVSIHFTKQPPKEVKVQYDESLKLTVEAVGPPPLHYLWCKDREIILGASDNPVLMIQSMSSKDKGTYQCTVYNKTKEIECKSTECEVKIIYPSSNGKHGDQPVITQQPTDKQECINGIAVFLVEAQCLHNLHYQWYHNGTILPGCFNNELRFVVKSRDQEGQYQCRISTDSGYAILSRLVQLKINYSKKGSAYYATDKLAILLGQSNYRSNNKQLPAVKNDLYEAHEVFSSLGFKTVSCLDNTLDEMTRVIHLAIDMMRGLGNDKLYVVVYVVGHGFVHHGVSYLMPCSATEGTQVSNCLSVEVVEKTIIKELNPVAFLMILDICQTEINHILQGELPPLRSGPVSKGMVIFRAATKGQEALETYQPESGASLKDESSQQMTSLGSWVDITSQKQLRGIFSQALFNILRKQEKLILQDLYKALNDVFPRPDPTFSTSKGKEQDPVFEINLEEERSLLDPINSQGQEKEYEERIRKYHQLTSKSLPSDFCIPLKSDADCWNIRGTFVIKASNVLEMVIYEEDKRPAHLRTLQVNYNIDAQSVPLQARPCHCYRYSGDPKLGIRQKNGFIFYNLQNLQSPLSFILNLTYSTPSVSPISMQVKAGYPLISHLRNMYPSVSENREACEHSDSGENEL